MLQVGGVEEFLNGFDKINLAQMLEQHKAGARVHVTKLLLPPKHTSPVLVWAWGRKRRPGSFEGGVP